MRVRIRRVFYGEVGLSCKVLHRIGQLHERPFEIRFLGCKVDSDEAVPVGSEHGPVIEPEPRLIFDEPFQIPAPQAQGPAVDPGKVGGFKP